MSLVRYLKAPMRAFVWTFDLCDAKGDPSSVKMMAAAIGVVALLDAWRDEFSVLNSSVLAMAISALLGRSVWMNWLGRNTWTSNASVALTGDVAEVIDATAKAVRERRDHDRGIDPA